MLNKGFIKFLLFTLCVTYVQIGFAQKVTVINQKGTKIDVVNNIVTTSATNPTDSHEGDVWFDTTNNLTKVFNGTNWLTININDADFDINNEIQDLTLIGNNLKITNNTGATIIDLTPYLDNTDAQTIALASNTITLSNGTGADTTVDLTPYISTDNQNLESAALSATSELAINIEDGNNVTVDLSSLEESAAITAVQDDVDQNESDADTAIAVVQTNLDTHITADKDIDATNELSDLSLNATSNLLTLTNAATGATGVDLTSYLNTDNQNIDLLAFNPANNELTVSIENGLGKTVNLSALYADGSETKINGGGINVVTGLGISTSPYIITATELDGDPENEIQTITAGNGVTVTPSGNDYTIFNSAPDQTVLLTGAGSTTITGTYPSFTINSNDTVDDADADSTNELSDLNLDTATNILKLTNPTTVTNQVDLSAYAPHTGTEGSVFFAGDDGKPTEQNDELFYDIDNKRVGIGTNTPTNKLEVSGAIRSAGILNSKGTVTEPSYRFTNDTNTGMYWRAADEIGLSVGGIDAIVIDEPTIGNTKVIITQTLELEGNLLDVNNSVGTVGQVLSSTVTGTKWVDVAAAETVTTITSTVTSGHKIGDYTNEDGGTPVVINETVTSLTQDDTSTTGEITFSDENGNTTGKAQVVSADADNQVKVGTDGGAFFQSPIKAFAKVEMTYRGVHSIYSSHTVAKQHNIASITRINEGDYTITFTNAMPDADYIIQLSIKDCGGNCPGNSNSRYDDPGITYYDQTTTGFKVNIGDSDNGATPKDDIDLEFMVTVISIF